MAVFLLKAKEDLPNNDNPWSFEYDKTHGGVVIAKDEEEARQLMSKYARDEVGDNNGDNPWLDSNYTICEEVNPDGESKVLLIDDRDG